MDYNNQLFSTVKAIQDSQDQLEAALREVTLPKEIIELNKKIAKNKDIVAIFQIYKNNVENIDQCRDAMKSEKNSELFKMMNEEMDYLKKEIAKNEENLQILLCPKDPNDDKNVIVEMRPAAGGNESSIFVSNLFDAYKRYTENNQWKLTIIDLQENNYGLSSLTFSLSGKSVYSKMKHESGVHRVQRIPETESKGRVHTSTVTVSCLPEQNDIEINIDPAELRIDVYRASGAGGQHVNKTESAVRVLHLPTGIIVACQQERSQISNREQAMKILRAKLWDIKTREQMEELSNKVRQQVGRGMRAEKIRTYNYPQNRITDHRISLTINNLDLVLMGDFSTLHESLMNNEITENLKLLALENELKN